jgi:RimJ/RimL family protein N-acetyltransferase
MDADTLRLRGHDVVLTGRHVRLRPMTETDWPLLLRWNQDPEVLHYAEGASVACHTLDEVQAIYRDVSQHATCFIAEGAGLLHYGEPIGEGWLQEMNLPRLLKRFPGEDLRRIDLMIGEKAVWGRGLGTEMVELLTWFAFEDQHADRVFGCEIADFNVRSLRAFERNGYHLFTCIPQPPDSKARLTYDVMLTRKQYLRDRG